MKKAVFLLVATLSVGAVSDARSWVSAQDAANTEAAVSFEQSIRPMLLKYCVECHTGEETETGFLSAESYADFVKLHETCTSPLEHIQQRSMPPADALQLHNEERKVVTEWLNANLPASARDRISQYAVAAFVDKQKELCVLWLGFSGELFRFNGTSIVNVSQNSPWGIFAASQTKQESILTAPEQWGSERLEFPLSFAPSLKYTGFEDIRFAPGWSKPDSPEYFTYKFAWKVEEQLQLSEELLADLMEKYFEGLAHEVVQRDGLPKPTAVFLAEEQGFRGRLRIYDGFSTNQWIYLNVKVEIKMLENKPVIVFSLSPKYFDHEVWKKLDEVQVKQAL